MAARLKLGGKRELNSELNLTPFIDLLSTMVCFLLIAAVWVQVGSMEVKQSYGSAAAAKPKVSYEMDLKFKSQNLSYIVVKRNGRRVKTIKNQGKDFEGMKEALSKNLEGFLNSKRYKNVEISSLMVTTTAKVQYGELVASLDIFRNKKISNIGLVPVQGGLK